MTAPIDLVAEHAYRLWRQREGWACVAHGVPYLDEHGKYRHRDFQEAYIAWPSDRRRLYQLALALRDERDVYIAPVLRSERRRLKRTAVPSWFVYGEVDDLWSPGHQATFDRIGGAGSFTVKSGGHGRHIYVALAEPVGLDDLERLNRRVAAMFGGDAKWDATALLRPCGTYHHKRRVREGAAPVLVGFDTRVVEDDRSVGVAA